MLPPTLLKRSARWSVPASGSVCTWLWRRRRQVKPAPPTAPVPPAATVAPAGCAVAAPRLPGAANQADERRWFGHCHDCRRASAPVQAAAAPSATSWAGRRAWSTRSEDQVGVASPLSCTGDDFAGSLGAAKLEQSDDPRGEHPGSLRRLPRSPGRKKKSDSAKPQPRLCPLPPRRKRLTPGQTARLLILESPRMGLLLRPKLRPTMPVMRRMSGLLQQYLIRRADSVIG